MKRTVKLWLITAAALLLLGCILFGGVMMRLNWDFTKLSTTRYETNRYEITEDFHSISINTDTTDVLFVPSTDASCRVECYEEIDGRHTVAVKDGVLVIEEVNTKQWFGYIGIGFDSPKITVTIPEGTYGKLTVRTDTGDLTLPRELSFKDIDVEGNTGDITLFASSSGLIRIKSDTGSVFAEDLSARALDLSVSTGNVTLTKISCTNELSIRVTTGDATLTDVTCQSLTTKGSTGDLTLKSVIAEGSFSIERSTGDVHLRQSYAAVLFIETDTGDVTLEECDAEELRIKTDTGDVKGSLLTEKIFLVDTDTGRKNVPKTSSGGRCEITTDTGNIIITID